MSRAIVTCFHYYTPYGHEFYQPIFNNFRKQMDKYKNEYDKLYIIEDTVENANLRYYDQYKKILPDIKEDLVLFLDNDMMVYKKGVIKGIFEKINKVEDGSFDFDIVSIYDTCGTYKTDKLNGKNKFCPYLFATRKDLLMKYINIDWGDHMPHSETFGLLTESMLNDGLVPYEIEEDKSDFPTKDLGYYHVRAGSTPAWLLAEKHYGNPKTYWDYLHNQPKSEYLRQCEWYRRMGGDPSEIIEDSK